jgi:hypothetical protein
MQLPLKQIKKEVHIEAGIGLHPLISLFLPRSKNRTLRFETASKHPTVQRSALIGQKQYTQALCYQDSQVVYAGYAGHCPVL